MRTIAYTYLWQRKAATYTELREYLENMLERIEDMTSKTELEAMKQNEGEGLLQFACRLRTQALMAFGMSYTTDQIKEQVNCLFLRSLA